MTLPAGLLREFGTPLYVYDLAAVRRSVRDLVADLPPGSQLLYSLKANPHPAIVQQMVDAGLGLEVSSSGELAVALAAQGRSVRDEGTRIVYTGPGKTDRELGTAIDHGISLFSVESVAERDRLARAATERGRDIEYLVRLNHPASGAGGSLRMTGRPTPFGLDTDDRDALEQALRPASSAAPAGLHTYFGTNVTDPGLLSAELVNAVESAAKVCGHTGHRPRLLDLGGGFSAPMARAGSNVRHPDLAAAVTLAAGRHWPEPDVRPGLLFESGRYLAATAGTLLTRVVDVKRTRGRTFVILDAGVQTLGGMSGLGRLHSPRVVPATWSEPARDDQEAAGRTPVALVGPLCTPLDILNPAVCPGTEVRAGSVLAIPNVGAYGLSASLVGFLGHPVAAEAVLDEDRLVSVRRLVLTPHELALPEPGQPGQPGQEVPA